MYSTGSCRGWGIPPFRKESKSPADVYFSTASQKSGFRNCRTLECRGEPRLGCPNMNHSRASQEVVALEQWCSKIIAHNISKHTFSKYMMLKIMPRINPCRRTVVGQLVDQSFFQKEKVIITYSFIKSHWSTSWSLLPLCLWILLRMDMGLSSSITMPVVVGR